MELGQCAIIKFFHFKKMNAAEIHSELVLCFGDNAYTLASAHHCVHEFKIGRVSIGDDPRPGRPPLDDYDATILKRLLEAPLSSLGTLNKDLNILRITVWEHMTESLSLQHCHFKRVPNMFTEELRRKRVDGAKALLKILETQLHIGFGDVITEDESWIFVNISLSSI
jgi:hypothetical protein